MQFVGHFVYLKKYQKYNPDVLRGTGFSANETFSIVFVVLETISDSISDSQSRSVYFRN